MRESAQRGPVAAYGQAPALAAVIALEFATETHAVRFEKYLKSGSGWAFAGRHFMTSHE